MICQTFRKRMCIALGERVEPEMKELLFRFAEEMKKTICKTSKNLSVRRLKLLVTIRFLGKKIRRNLCRKNLRIRRKKILEIRTKATIRESQTDLKGIKDGGVDIVINGLSK